MPTKPLMTDQMEHLLWANIDDQKGDNSLWITDFDEAHAAICAKWQAHGYNKLSRRQLYRFFYNTAQRRCNTRCSHNNIFTEGTVLLKPTYRLRALPVPITPTTVNVSSNYSISVAIPTTPVGSVRRERKMKIGQLANFPCAACSMAGRECVITACDSCCHGCTIDKRKARRDRSDVSPRPALRKKTKDMKLAGSSRSGSQSSTSSITGNAQSRAYTSQQSIHPSRPQSIDEGDPLTVDNRSAAVPNTFGSNPIQSLESLISEDHDSFLPNNGLLDKLHEETLLKISAVVSKIIGVTQYSRGGQPQFLLTAHSSQSFLLLKRICGTRPMSPQELVHQIVAKQMQSMESPIGIATALQALIGAAVFEWVFQASQSSSPGSAQDTAQTGIDPTGLVAPLFFQKHEYCSTLEKLLSDACPRLHEQLVLKSKYHFVENGFDYETPATTLASHFYAAMKSFFKDNLWNLDPMVYVQFHGGLEDIFTSALKLKAWTCLDPTAFSFQWPDADSPFDPATMKDDNENIDDSGNGIRLSLFAALTRLHSDANTTTIVDLDPTERCIARAVVLL